MYIHVPIVKAARWSGLLLTTAACSAPTSPSPDILRAHASASTVTLTNLAATQSTPSYEVADLGYLDCGLPGTACKSSQAEDINETGAVAGGVTVPGCFHAALWRLGHWEDLGALWNPPPGSVAPSSAFGINALDQVVGESSTATPHVTHAFFWERGTGMHDLGVLGRYTICFGDPPYCATVENSEGRAINDRGQIVGTSSTNEGTLRALLYENGVMRDIGTLPGKTRSEGSDINNLGQVVGTSRGAGLPRAFLWEQGAGMIDLGVLDEGVPVSQAEAINNASEVVGMSRMRLDGLVFLRGFIWTNGLMRALPPFPGDQDSWALDVNDRGQVVGISLACRPSCTMRPVLWDGDLIIDLGGIPGADATFNKATGINARGQVVGTSLIDAQSATNRAFLAEPHRTTPFESR